MMVLWPARGNRACWNRSVLVKKQLAVFVAALGLCLGPVYLVAQKPAAQAASRVSTYAPAERIPNLDSLKTCLLYTSRCV